MAAIGIVIGLLGGFALSRALGSMLYETSPADPVAYGAVALLLGVVALLAAALPARRAARVNPVAALKYE